MFTNEWKQGKIYAYSVILKSTQKAIGSIDIHNIDNNNKAEKGVLHDALYKYDRYFDAKIYAKINNS